MKKAPIIPEKIEKVGQKLKEAGFEAFLVGGCVRDLLLGVWPKDWDVTTNAKPEEVLEIFPKGKYENVFGTVLVPEKYLDKEALPLASEKFKINKKHKEELLASAKKYLKNIECAIRGEQHSKNVLEKAFLVAQDYPGVSKDFLEIICWFHDVGKIKFSDKNHIEESRRIFEKEAGNKLERDSLEKISFCLEHNSHLEPKFLEQQILIEADILDGIDVARCRLAKKNGPETHFDWIKKAFKGEDLYGFFLTAKGKFLLIQAIKIFNQADLGFSLPEFSDGRGGVVEITTFRIESTYGDKRHPDKVKFANRLEDDLSRRDFTVNAMALKIGKKRKGETEGSSLRKSDFENFEVVDLFGGKKDLENKIIRAVGTADQRFFEDALRMMRAIRFSAQLGFEVEEKTLQSIQKNAKNLKEISFERIRDEFVKIILSKNPAEGVDNLRKTGLLNIFLPELLVGFETKQNHHHVFTVYQHNLLSLKNCPSEKLEVRLAALFHDVAKPQTKRGQGKVATFYNHELVGARMTRKILTRLKFSKEIMEKTVLLVANHMFYYNAGEVSEASVRRLIAKVGLENMRDLIDLRIADRLGSGVPKAKPYKLRHFEYMVEKVSTDAVSVKMLKINGNDLMRKLKIPAGPKIGAILEVLLAEVIEESDKNTKENLLKKAEELKKENLAKIRKMAKQNIEKKKKKDDAQIKGKYWVQ